MNIIRLKQLLFTVMALCLSAWASADTYTYDSLNRLTAVTYTSGGGQTYAYDPAGNLLALVSTPPATSDHTLAVSLAGAGSGTVTGTGINCGSTCSTSLASGASVTLTANPASGSRFAGWSGACFGYISTCVVSIGMDPAPRVTASFDSYVAPTVAVSVNRVGTGSGIITSTAGGINCGSLCSGLITVPSNVTLTATPSSGSTFVGWSGDCSGMSCVLVTDAANMQNRNVTASFTANAGSGDLSLPLVLAQGWNLLGNSLSQPILVGMELSNPALVTTVWKWDAVTPGWQFYAPSMDAATLQTYATGKGYGVLSVINPGEGYWVNAKSAASLGTQFGSAFSLTTGNLVKGWNLVATGNDVLPAVFNLSLSDMPPALGTVPLNVTTLWAWDNPLSQWYFYAPSLDASGGLAAYIAGKSYLDFTQHNKTLGNGAGFWVNKP